MKVNATIPYQGQNYRVNSTRNGLKFWRRDCDEWNEIERDEVPPAVLAEYRQIVAVARYGKKLPDSPTELHNFNIRNGQ